MNEIGNQRYFVGQLDEFSYRPLPEAEFEIQILNVEGQAECIAYVDRQSNDVLALIHATKGRIAVENHDIPLLVIQAARQRRGGMGEYVNERGEPIRPKFLPPR